MTNDTHRTAETLPYDPSVPAELVRSRLAWRDLFGNDLPVEVDIGCGRGRFLIESGSRNTARNYLGVEKMGKPYHVARERVAKRELHNVRVLRDDAHRFVSECVADASVAAYYIHFPDPWPKKKHHKRRVITSAFVDELARTLAPEGTLSVATDIADYFDELLMLIETTSRFALIEEGSYDEDVYLTNFAAKYRQQGREMLRAKFRLGSRSPE